MMALHLARLYYSVELILMLLIASAKVFVLSQPFCNDSRLNREPQPICPGGSLQISCVVSGPGFTVYNGDALPRQCPDNGITLFHNRFPNTSLSCGNAVGQSLTVFDNQYESQLSLNLINCNQNSTFIICQHDDGINSRDICKYPLNIQESSPPHDIHLSNVSFDSITFSWNNTASMCSAITYNINSSGCGTCPNTTNLTTATCLNVRFNSSEPCIFSVIASICESDAASTPFNATFRDLVSVPDITSVVPTYSQQSLLVSFELHFQIKISLPIPPDANVTAISHNVSYTNSISSELCLLNPVDPITECFNDTCQVVLKVMTTSCQSLDITVTLSSNVYGITKTSIPLHIDGSNKFVMVTYNPVKKTLTCTFLNIEDMSEKTCNVSYVVCESNATKTAQGIFDVLQPSVVDVQLQLSDQNVYCYSVTAANDTFIVVVKGNTTTISDPPSKAGVIGGSVAAIVSFLMAVALLILTITVLCFKFKGKCTSQSATEDHPLGEVMLCTTQQPPKQAKQVEDMETTFVELEPVSDSFRLYTVDKPTGLRKYVEERIPEVEFSRGCAFYEFKNSTEDVDKTSRVILMDKETKEFFSGQNAYDVAFKSCTKTLISDTRFEICRPNNERYTIFVQDSGSGSRFLDKDSYLLVDIEREPSNYSPRNLGLTEVPSDHFQKFKVTEDSQLHSFITSNHRKYWRGCAFYEFSHDSEDISGDKEVLLLDVKSDKLYTGERAKTMVGVPGDGIRNRLRGKNNWRVFIQSRCTGNRHLDRNTMLLYQIKPPKDDHAKSHNQQKKRQSVDNYLVADSSGDFKVIPVHESCSLRKFIDEHEETNGYERKCAYFEFYHDEEDITDKDIILMDTKGELHLGGGAIEKIGGHVSTIGVKKPNLPDFPRVFIQCNGPGYSVHIEAGSSIIYKDPKIGNLEPVDLNEYDKFEVTTTSELRSFVEEKVGEFKRGAAFYQFTCDYEDISKDKKVLLMSKDNNAMYTGAAACHKIGAPGKGIRRPPDDFQYTVFVQNKSRGSRCLLEGTILLYKKNFEDDNEGTVLK